MPEKIQRVPRGLVELLSISGGLATRELLEQVRGVVDQLQFYGLQQRVVGVNQDAALAEAGSVSLANVTALAPLTQQWAILFAATFTVQKTATMTACRIGVNVVRGGGLAMPYANDEVGPFGATETGTANVGLVCPYPMLLPPPWDIRGFLAILGTDANASVIITAELGILAT